MEDESLVELVLDGDDEALRILYDRYFQPLFQYAYLQTGDYHHAEEVTQDIFSKMVRNLRSFQGKSSFKTWLYTIGRNVVIDFHRSQKRHKKLISMPEIDVEKFMKHVSYKHEDVMSEQLARGLAKLPTDYRAVIHLRYFEELSIAETAKILSKSVLSIKSLQHRAKRKLLNLINNEVSGK